MTVTYNPTNVANITNPSTAANQINSNFTAISSAFQSAFNSSGDSMLGTFNANNQQIINLPPPGTSNSPARLIDVTASTQSSILAANLTGVSANSILGNNTASAGNAVAIGVTGSSNVVLACTPTLTTPNLVSPNITGTVTGDAVYNSILINNASGVAANVNTVGYYAITGYSYPIGMSNNSTIALQSMLLGPGDWDIGCAFAFTLSTGLIDLWQVGISTTPGTFNFSITGSYAFQNFNGISGLGGLQANQNGIRTLISSNTTFYLNGNAFAIAQAGISPSPTNLQAGGLMWARMVH
jgi:hypothetical protein